MDWTAKLWTVCCKIHTPICPQYVVSTTLVKKYPGAFSQPRISRRRTAPSTSMNDVRPRKSVPNIKRWLTSASGVFSIGKANQTWKPVGERPRQVRKPVGCSIASCPFFSCMDFACYLQTHLTEFKVQCSLLSRLGCATLSELHRSFSPYSHSACVAFYHHRRYVQKPHRLRD